MNRIINIHPPVGPNATRLDDTTVFVDQNRTASLYGTTATAR